MPPPLLAFLVGTLGGPIGGLLAALAGATILRQASNRVRGGILALAGGFILAVAFLELLQRGIEQTQGWQLAVVLIGVTAGAALRAGVARLAGGGHGKAGGEGGDESGSGNDEAAYRKSQAYRIAASLAVVNIVEGLTIGIGFAVGTQLGLLLGAIMIFENFTEGITVSTELAQGEHGTKQMLVATVAPTLTLGVGGAIGAFLGGLSPIVQAGLLGGGAGIMLYVVADDVLYDAHQLGPGAASSAPLIGGVLLGTALVALGVGGHGG